MSRPSIGLLVSAIQASLQLGHNGSAARGSLRLIALMSFAVSQCDFFPLFAFT